MGQHSRERMDEIDRVILGILAENPRTPYSDISDRLAEQGFQMSSEGIRYRVKNLFDATSTFFMLDPKDHDWQIVRMMITLVDEAGAKEAILERLSELPFWFITAGIGTFDVYTVTTVPTTAEVEELLDKVRAIEVIDGFEYNIETRRRIDLGEYLPITEDS